MPETRVAQALARLEEHHQLHLPLRRTDLLGRLALRFLWRRQLKWQIETNLAIRDALRAIEELAQAQRDGLATVTERTDRGTLVNHEQLQHEVSVLRQSDQHLTAGLNQRLYSSLGRVESQLGDLRLRLAETAENSGGFEQRVKAIEDQVATLSSAARDVRLRHAQLDLYLDELRDARPGRPKADVAGKVASRDSFLELALSELLDGPSEQLRAARGSFLPVVTEARENGATGAVLDMAPARGEWLEVLRAAGVPYLAASANSLVRRHCKALDLTVEDADSLDVLAGAAQRTLGAVTAFRFVERQDPVALASFMDSAAAALQPGGALIIETPAAKTADFHLDPFAKNPVHPDFLRFLAESAGFARVEIRTSAEDYELGDNYRLIAWR
jgi:hypothetical protein